MKTGVGKLKIGSSYGSNMIKVLSALEAYWENRNNTLLFQEQLLYNLWKVSNKWLELKKEKSQNGTGSELFLRRKLNVELLRDESLAELAAVSPNIAQALQGYQNTKLQGSLGYELKGLSNGYHRERVHYLQNHKKSGSTISGSQVHGQIGDINKDRNPNPKAKKLAQKGFGNLSLQETQRLQKMFSGQMPPVVYMNKIARLKYIVSIIDGKFCDADGNPILMEERSFGNRLTMAAYAMDEYGNLYVKIDFGFTEYLEQKNGTYRVGETHQFNHSSFLAGKDVICAGVLHIGWDNRRQAPSAGVLSAIDNSSGHYKPTAEQLRNCLEVLQGLGVNIDLTRVGDMSQDPRTFYWGRDFMSNRYPWPDPETPPNSFFKAPPIQLSI